MKKQIQFLPLAALALFIGGCAGSSVKQTWISPSYMGGSLQKIAVVAVADRPMARVALENRFMRALRRQGQNATNTHELMSLAEMKADKEAAASRLRAAGADAVMIVRLVDQSTYDREVPRLYVQPVANYPGYAWYNHFSIVYDDMGPVRGSGYQDKVYLDSSLFDLKTGQRLWSALSLTVLKEDADRLEEADRLVEKVVYAMRKDGLIRR